VEIAWRLHRQPGLAFLDSSLATGESTRSYIASHPRAAFKDWSSLHEAFAKLRENRTGAFAALIGAVTYDGTPYFQYYDRIAVFDHSSTRWNDPTGLLDEAAATEEPPPPEMAPMELKREMASEDFQHRVARVIDYIAAGDIYQANLSHRFHAEPCDEPFTLYRALRYYSPAPYGAYLDFGETAILSSSPELFLDMHDDQVITRPIKGTRPRFANPAEDQASEEELVRSPKECAELVMITDLERNDLGQVCRYGSVHVREMLKLERFAQVFHLVSTVEGRLREDISHLEALRACFPGGSITGAPKKRAMEIIAELEPVPRGYYTGAIGFFGTGGISRFNIAIRTAVWRDRRITYHAGAGIVAGSDPASEDVETEHKANGIRLACANPLGWAAPSR
jgi:para-aminobenzoate synthetase component 1